MKKKIMFFLILLFSLSISSVANAHEYALSYFFGGTSTQYTNYLDRAGDVLNNICPDYFEINSDGSLKIQKIDKNFINNTKSRGITITPFISNHWDRDLGITALNNMENLSTQIARAVYDNNLDGIDVDIENVSHLQRDAYTNFVKLLRAKMPDKIISVAVAANPNNWQIGWHGAYDYTNLAKYCNYLMIMGYDESYYSSPAGPVASSTFTEKSILYALSKTTPDKLVLGIPFFGRYWKQGATVGGNGITSMDVSNLIKNYKYTKKYFNDSQSAQVMLTITENDIPPKIWGGVVLTPGTYEIWYDDLTSSEYKLNLVNKYNLRGSGSWAMGQDIIELWSVYAKYKNVPVTGVVLSPKNNNIEVGKTKKLNAAISPLTASNKAVTWSSSDSKIAKVSDSGIVTGVKNGRATITVKTDDGAKTATAIVNVITSVKSVKVVPATANINHKKTKKLTAIVSPSTATNKNVTWKSSDTKIAKISNTGVVTGLKIGKASITVSTVDGSKKAVCKISVIVPVSRVKISSTKTTLRVGKTKRLTAKVLPANATIKKITWISSDEKVVKVNSKGLITALKVGKATITAKSNNGNKKAVCKVSVVRLKKVSANPVVLSNKSIYDDVITKGWISKDEFDEDAKLTRAQAIKSIMRMSTNLPDVTGNILNFKDTNNHPDFEFIRKARYYGIIDAQFTNKFSPQNAISKLELIIWMDRVFDLPDTVNFENSKVKDNIKKNNPEAYYAINKYIEHEIITVDKNAKFHPKQTITMGEFALIINRLSNVGIKDLKPILYEGEQQRKKFLTPR